MNDVAKFKWFSVAILVVIAIALFRLKMWLEFIAVLILIPCAFYIGGLMERGAKLGEAFYQLEKRIVEGVSDLFYFIVRPWLWFKVLGLWLEFFSNIPSMGFMEAFDIFQYDSAVLRGLPQGPGFDADL